MVALILLKGQPGSGKSTIGQALARYYRCCIIDKDDARNAFQELYHAHPTIDWNTLSYQVTKNYVKRQLGLGLTTIVDCPLARRELFDGFASFAKTNGASIALIECVPGDEKIWKERLEARGKEDAGTHRAHKPGSWEDLDVVLRRNNGSEQWTSDSDVVIDCHIQIDTTSSGIELSDHINTITNELDRCNICI